MSAFDQALNVVLGWEGGFTDDFSDPGNWTGGRVNMGQLRGTNHGISAASYPALDIRGLTLEAAGAIYRRDYWDRVRGDDLAGPLALLVFDAAVNNGVGRAVRWLQQTADASQDGEVGPLTLAAVAERVSREGVTLVCGDYHALRLLFMSDLETWRTFGGGWARRLALIPFQSVLMKSDASDVA